MGTNSVAGEPSFSMDVYRSPWRGDLDSTAVSTMKMTREYFDSDGYDIIIMIL